MAYLVDTDVLVDVAKGTEGAADFLNSLQSWSLSVVTAMELIVGAKDKRDVEKIEELFAAFETLPVGAAVGQTAYRLVRQFAKSHGLRVFDALIAATAIEQDRILVTRNRKHFQMIPALRLESPEY